jgi:broad specificity phosphatase PhoE
MTDPLARLRSRISMVPLLVPLIAVIVVGAGAVWLSLSVSTTLVVLVRHAEPAVSNTGDPDLNPAGERRAALLGPFLADALAGRPVDHLYAADTRRAQQTAASVANHFKLPVNLLAGSDWSGLASRLRREHRGETVVVIGYASTLPGVLNQLSGSQVTVDPDDYGSVYVVAMPSPGEARTLRLRYGEPPASPALGAGDR